MRDAEEFPVEDVTVNVNGVEATSDVHGRYIAEYVASQTRTINRVRHANSVFVETAHEGSRATRTIEPFAANGRLQVDVALSGVGKTASVSGTVTASGSGDPIAGVEIKVDDAAPNNAATRGVNAGKLVTGADGSYTAIFKRQGPWAKTISVSAEKAGMSFSPGTLCCYPAHADAASSGANFTGFLHARISGRVSGPDGNALGDVTVTAVSVSGGTGDNVSSTSNARGTFVLSVPFGTYDIEASKALFSFTYPNDNQRVSVAPGQELDFGEIEATAVTDAATLSALSLSAGNLGSDVRQRSLPPTPPTSPTTSTRLR